MRAARGSRAVRHRTARPSRRRATPARAAGEYQQFDSAQFGDMNAHLCNLFTHKATAVVLGQLAEMDPSRYTWLHDFAARHPPSRAKQFVTALFAADAELAERVLLNRLALYNDWLRHFDLQSGASFIDKENVAAWRTRLEAVVTLRVETGDPAEPDEPAAPFFATADEVEDEEADETCSAE